MMRHAGTQPLMGMAAYLEREYGRRHARNRRYTLRAFARDLGCDHSTLSQWMRRTRPITHEAAEQICDALRLFGPDRQIAREIDATDLSVLSSIRATGARDTSAVATATGLTTDQVNLSLFKLLRLVILRMDGERWRLCKEEVL